MKKIGKKFDSQKLQISLIPPEPIEEITKVLMVGEKKYGKNNWKVLDNAEERYYDALRRHLSEYEKGNLFDNDDGLSHISHALTNLIFLSYFEVNKKQINKPMITKIGLKYSLKSYGITPTRDTNGASGIDIYSPKNFSIPPYEDILISSGVCFDIPEGFDLTVCNKSGISTKKKLIKGAELIDNDYIGEVHIHLFNLSKNPTGIKKGEKIIQLVLRPVNICNLIKIKKIKKKTLRGKKGFGSTSEKGVVIWK